MSKDYHRGVQLKAYVPVELKAAVEERAKELGLRLSDGIREALESWSGGVVVIGRGLPEYSDARAPLTQKSKAPCGYSDDEEVHELSYVMEE